MKKIQQYHESPNAIFGKVQEITDGDYLLSHLYIENEKYKELFQEALLKGRRVIVDNSIFEGKGLSNTQYIELLKELNKLLVESGRYNLTLEYIIPDVLEDCDQTCSNIVSFMNEIELQGLSLNQLGVPIGVVQGKTYKEIVKCYEFMVNSGMQKIAISFDYSFYEAEGDGLTKLFKWCYGRPALLERMLQDGVIRQGLPHHLLGCSLSREFGYYASQPHKFFWIESLDTSNPVVSALHGLNYPNPFGLDTKPSMKLCDMIDREVSDEEWEVVKDNILKFTELLDSNTTFEFNFYKGQYNSMKKEAANA